MLAPVGDSRLCSLGGFSGGRDRRKMEGRRKEGRMTVVFVCKDNTVASLGRLC